MKTTQIRIRNNCKIKNATKTSSNGIDFKSQLEKTIYNCLLELGFSPEYEPETYTLIEGYNPITPFYDKETDKQKEKRLKEGIDLTLPIEQHDKIVICDIALPVEYMFQLNEKIDLTWIDHHVSVIKE